MPEQKWEMKEVGISVVKGLIGAVPYAGTALNEVLFESRGRIKQKRINTFIEHLSSYMSSFNEKDIDFEHIKSEEFGDIFESILKRVAYNRSIEKLHRFKKILANQIISPKQTVFTETFLDLVQRLEEAQIQILDHYKKINKGEIEREKEITERGTVDGGTWGGEEDVKGPSDLDAKYFHLDETSYKFFVQDLISKSLLFDDSINRIDSRPFEVLQISQFGMEFLNFLDE
jgi:hypothetical protein